MDKTTEKLTSNGRSDFLEAVERTLHLEYIMPSDVLIQPHHAATHFISRGMAAVNQYVNGEIEFQEKGSQSFVTNEHDAVFISPGVLYRSRNLSPGKSIRKGMAFRFSVVDTLDPVDLLDVPWVLKGKGALIAELNQELLDLNNTAEADFLTAAVSRNDVAFRMFREILAMSELKKNAFLILQNNMRLHHVLSYIKTHYMDDLQIRQLAKRVSLSVSRFFDVFRSYTGMSPNQYILNQRINKAQELLLSDLKIYEIADQVGIHDPFYFSRIFKKRVGISPEAFRRLNR